MWATLLSVLVAGYATANPAAAATPDVGGGPYLQFDNALHSQFLLQGWL